MQALKGSLVALVTPFTSKGDVDYVALKELVDWHIEEGTNGIVSVGTTGESATLTVKEHLKVIEHTVNFVNGRIPVIAGSGSNSTAQAIETTSESKKLGADYSLLVTPYYNKPSQQGLIKHFSKIADSVDIPQILYNVPTRTSCDIAPATVKILSEHENIIGIKEAVDNMDRIKELVSIKEAIKSDKEFYIYSGDDPTFLDAIKLGADGVISVVANAIPHQISLICDYSLNNNLSLADEINKKYISLYDLCFIESNPVPIKWILYKLNKIQNIVRLPLVKLDETFHEKIMSEMVKLELL
tara:strand:+ start:1392 stop:2288 length:897 start_codon:yes stop_codon:yes gene_type:complete